MPIVCCLRAVVQQKQADPGRLRHWGGKSHRVCPRENGKKRNSRNRDQEGGAQASDGKTKADQTDKAEGPRIEDIGKKRSERVWTGATLDSLAGPGQEYWSNRRLGKACQQPNWPSKPLTRIVSSESRETLPGPLSCQG